MFEIGKTFKFEAAHSLPYVAPNHKCRRLHGHNYQVDVTLHSEFLDVQGFVWDYGNMVAFRDYLEETHDHRNLNDVYENPTAENMAQHLYEWVEKQAPFGMMLHSVTVKETDNTFATYRRSLHVGAQVVTET